MVRLPVTTAMYAGAEGKNRVLVNLTVSWKKMIIRAPTNPGQD